jgi:hypothetical protein
MTMTPQSLLLGPTADGWSVFLSDGRELAHFRGLCAHWRAERYLARFVG